MTKISSFHHKQEVIILNGTDGIVRHRGPSRSPVMDVISWQPRLWHECKRKPADVFLPPSKVFPVRLVRCPNNFRFHVLQNDFALICCRRTNRTLSQRGRSANCTRCSRIPQLPLALIRDEKNAESLELATPDCWPTTPAFSIYTSRGCTFFCRINENKKNISYLRFLSHLDAVLSVTG